MGHEKYRDTRRKRRVHFRLEADEDETGESGCPAKSYRKKKVSDEQRRQKRPLEENPGASAGEISVPIFSGRTVGQRSRE
jgi:hypothetical protein